MINSKLNNEYSELYSVDQAVKRMKEILAQFLSGLFLNVIPKLLHSKNIVNKSIISSNFVASLELSKNGHIEVKQEETFGNIYIRLKINNE